MSVLEHTGACSLVVNSGEIVSVLGAPGSGKTRLALELAFLARPAEGEVLFHGENPMTGRSLANRPSGVTMLVQNAEDQLFARTVFDDVAFGPRHLVLDEEEIATRVLSAIYAVGLNPFAIKDRSPFALSGGERRRVALAGVIAMEPEVLILDEPTSNLDPHTRDEFLTLLAPLRGKSSVVWMTSSSVEAAHADRTYLLRNGQTIEVRAGGELFADWHELAGAGIDMPAVFTLAGLLERFGRSLPATASPVELQEAIVQDWFTRYHDR